MKLPSAGNLKMSKQKNVTLLKPWGMHLKGARLRIDAPVADLLIQRGAAEEIKPASKKADTKPGKPTYR
jgi:hypothetical protein